MSAIIISVKCYRDYYSAMSKKQLLLDSYFSTINDETSKKRYLDKLCHIGGLDPYQTGIDEWEDNTDLWPSIIHINLGMYLLAMPSPYSGDDLLNYKSLDSYIKTLCTWVG